MPDGSQRVEVRGSRLPNLVAKVKESRWNILRTKHTEVIGKSLARDTDLAHYETISIWSGDYLDFQDNRRESPAAGISQALDKPDMYAFRAVGNKEFEAIRERGGIGGQEYAASGIRVTDGTLFSATLAAPLSMFDGKRYGPEDDRHKGGYILAIGRDVVAAAADADPNDEGYKVKRRIPLADVHTVFRVQIAEPDDTVENDGMKHYTISRLVPKPSHKIGK